MDGGRKRRRGLSKWVHIGQNCKKAVVNIQLHCTFVAVATPVKLLGIYLGTRLAYPRHP